MNKFFVKLEKLVNKSKPVSFFTFLLNYQNFILNSPYKIMKLSRRTLLKLKNKNKKLKPNKYKKLKRQALRGKIKGTQDRPRLSVYRSNENIYAQIIDDTTSKTLLTCSTLDRSIKLTLSTRRNCEASRVIGEKLAELSLEKNIKKIVFDRGPYLYHGRIKALADGARAGGLKF